MHTNSIVTWYRLSYTSLNFTVWLLEDKEFQSQLLGRFRRRQEEGYISDVYDGKAYLAHMVEEGFLSNPMNISMLLNTDGIQVFKSSNLSLWPIYLVINELPPHLRVVETEVYH